MAKIERKEQKIFGGNLSPSGNIAIYGSREAGSPSYSDNLDTIQSQSWLQGILGATSPAKAPYIQDLNAIFYVITKQLAYLFQAGVAEWNSQTEYFANNSICQHNGKVYSCIADNTNKEPGASGWETYWISFNFATDIIPTGTIVPFASTTVPSGWLLTNGSDVSRSTYSKLFSVIGTTFGAGNGSTTFNLPNFTKRTFWYDTTIGNKGSALPNITGEVYPVSGDTSHHQLYTTGAFVVDFPGGDRTNSGGSSAEYRLKINASNSNAIYGAEAYVRPQSVGMPFIIKC